MIETTQLISELPITVAPAKFLNQIERVDSNHPRWDYIVKGIENGYSEIKVVYRINSTPLSKFPMNKMVWLVKVEESKFNRTNLFLILPPEELTNKMLLTGLPPQLFVNY